MHRHRDVSRLEGFSDAVFGFALTLLVVSLEVPETMDALRTQMRGFVPFALMLRSRDTRSTPGGSTGSWARCTG